MQAAVVDSMAVEVRRGQIRTEVNSGQVHIRDKILEIQILEQIIQFIQIFLNILTFLLHKELLLLNTSNWTVNKQYCLLPRILQQQLIEDKTRDLNSTHEEGISTNSRLKQPLNDILREQIVTYL